MVFLFQKKMKLNISSTPQGVFTPAGLITYYSHLIPQNVQTTITPTDLSDGTFLNEEGGDTSSFQTTFLKFNDEAVYLPLHLRVLPDTQHIPITFRCVLPLRSSTLPGSERNTCKVFTNGYTGSDSHLIPTPLMVSAHPIYDDMVHPEQTTLLITFFSHNNITPHVLDLLVMYEQN